jgi:hypothetical protein
MELTQTLKAFIEEGQDWERKNTSVKGVSIIRLPATKNRAASLAIDINPRSELLSRMKKLMVLSRLLKMSFPSVKQQQNPPGQMLFRYNRDDYGLLPGKKEGFL